jgi:serine protease Do
VIGGKEQVMAMAISELGDAVGRAAKEVGPSVVGLGDRWAVGSGVVLEPGRVLTNAHNVGRKEVRVTFDDGREETGVALGADLDGDVAVVEVDTGDAAPIRWEEAVTPGIGAPVLALANPGGRGLRVTFGLVSGTERSFRGPRGRRITGSLEHTAPLLPGSSGGPVVDVDGNFLGLNTNRLGEGFYLAIPADAALRQSADRLGRGETPEHPRLGVGLAPSRVARRLRRAVGLPDADGLLIRQVEEGSPADRSGLEEGDLIIAAGGVPTPDYDALAEALRELQEKGSIELTVLRGTEERAVTVTK